MQRRVALDVDVLDLEGRVGAQAFELGPRLVAQMAPGPAVQRYDALPAVNGSETATVGSASEPFD